MPWQWMGPVVISLQWRNLEANWRTGALEKITGKFNYHAFSHPIYFIPDAVHMLKLGRNALADLGSFADDENRKIEWRFIAARVPVQPGPWTVGRFWEKPGLIRLKPWTIYEFPGLRRRKSWTVTWTIFKTRTKSRIFQKQCPCFR